MLRARRLAVCGAAAAVLGLVSPAVGALAAMAPSPAAALDAAPGAAPAAPGFWLASEDGNVSAFGAAQPFGSRPQPATETTTCMASTPDGNGYWLLGARGTLSSFGDAAMRGSADSTTLVRPIVGVAPTADGKGYWEVATDGGIFNYGDAPFLGSAASLHLNQPIVGIAATPDGGGYWLVAADGGIFNYGDAKFFGSAGALPLVQPIVGMAVSPDGGGYWLAANDGGVFSYGDAHFHGSAGAIHLAAPVIGMAADPTGDGYWLAAEDGGTFNYGDAPFIGSLGGKAHPPVVAIAAPGQGGGCLGAALPRTLVTPGPGGPAGEGVWVPAARRAGSTAAVYTTTLRPSPNGAPAGIAWVDTDRTVTRLYAGPPSEPAGAFAASAEVTPGDRPTLLAGFNSGFRVNQSNGGWFSEHQTPIPLVNGSASLVIYGNRTVKLGVWGRDVTLTPDVVSVRQNLTPLIDQGHVAADINNGFDWGPVLGGIGNTWRSGLGIDATGHLLYAAGPGLFPVDLANVLLAAGAVEAMELDINPLWPLFSTYASPAGQPPSVVEGTKLLAGMSFDADHYLAPSDRDFFAVFAR